LAGFAVAVLAAFTVSVLALEAAGLVTFVAVVVLVSAMVFTPEKNKLCIIFIATT
jgi:hypothetical protein